MHLETKKRIVYESPVQQDFSILTHLQYMYLLHDILSYKMKAKIFLNILLILNNANLQQQQKLLKKTKTSIKGPEKEYLLH